MSSLPDLLLRHLPDLLHHHTDLLPVVILAAWVAYLIKEKKRPPPGQVQIIINNVQTNATPTDETRIIPPSAPRKR